jgi:hypothetical protein
MSPMPPPGGMPPLAPFFSGRSATIASVVISRPENRGRILQSRAHDLSRVDDAGLDQVLELAGLRVEAEVVGVVLQRLAGDDRAVFTGILGDLAQRGLDRLADDLDPEALVVVIGLDLAQDQGCPRQGNTAARNDTFLDRRTRGVQAVIDAILTLLHFHFGAATDADDGNAAGRLRQTLLQLLAVVVRGGLLDLRPDLPATALDVGLLAGTFTFSSLMPRSSLITVPPVRIAMVRGVAAGAWVGGGVIVWRNRSAPVRSRGCLIV